MPTFNNGFDGQLLLAAGANSLKALLKAAGYAGRYGATFALINNRTGADIYYGRRADVDATNGALIPDATSRTFQVHGQGTVDFNNVYVFSAADGVIDFVINTR
jgi:hypothetical protein